MLATIPLQWIPFRYDTNDFNDGKDFDGKQKEQLFETTDVERALRLISAGIQTLGHGSTRVSE